MNWKYNCWTGNHVGRYKDHQIVRTVREIGKTYFYSTEIRNGLNREYLTFFSLKQCKNAINDKIRRTTQ